MSMVENAGNWEAIVREENVAKTVLFLELLRQHHPERSPPNITKTTYKAAAPAEPEKVDLVPEPSAPSVPAPVPLGPIHPVTSLLRSASRKFGLTMEELLSRRHHPEVVRARHIVMFLGMEHTSLSFPEMGRRMGGRDHTTILSGVRKMRRLLAGGDTQLAADIDAVRTRAFPAAAEEPIWS